jgi:hypothetical protein
MMGRIMAPALDYKVIKSFASYYFYNIKMPEHNKKILNYWTLMQFLPFKVYVHGKQKQRFRTKVGKTGQTIYFPKRHLPPIVSSFELCKYKHPKMLSSN